jgi:hypothetical protein
VNLIQNPNPWSNKTDTWLLYFTGYGKTNPLASRVVGVAYAPSLKGPWLIWPTPVFKANTKLGTVLVFRQDFALEDAIGPHACSLEANMSVTNGIPLGSPRLLPVDTVNYVDTLKVRSTLPVSRTQHQRLICKLAMGGCF